MLNEPRDSRKQAPPFADNEPRTGQEVCEGPAVSRASFMVRMVAFRAESICFALIAVGLAISIYHLWRIEVLAGQRAGRTTDACLALFGAGCDSLLTNPVSIQFGLPVAGWGLIYYATLAVFLLLGRLLRETFEFEARFAALLLSLAALIGSGVLAGMMFRGLIPFCPLCALAHVVNLAIVFSLLRLTGRPIPQLTQALMAGGRSLVTGEIADPILLRWKLVGLSTVGLVAVVLYQWIFIEAPPQALVMNPQQLLAEFETKAKQDIPVGTGDPTLGPANAPAQIVVFSDFQCPACRRYTSQIHTLAEQYAGKLQIVYKHFPLNLTCNPTLEKDIHPRACEAAYAAEAARKQGKFWRLHDKLFATDLQEDATVFDSLAEASGLDLERFKRDFHDESTKAKVNADIELAKRLSVSATPTVFLNRRPVSDGRLHSMRVLIDHLLRTAATAPSGVPQQRVAAASSEQPGVSH